MFIESPKFIITTGVTCFKPNVPVDNDKRLRPNNDGIHCNELLLYKLQLISTLGDKVIVLSPGPMDTHTFGCAFSKQASGVGENVCIHVILRVV